MPTRSLGDRKRLFLSLSLSHCCSVYTQVHFPYVRLFIFLYYRAAGSLAQEEENAINAADLKSPVRFFFSSLFLFVCMFMYIQRFSFFFSPLLFRFTAGRSGNFLLFFFFYFLILFLWHQRIDIYIYIYRT